MVKIPKAEMLDPNSLKPYEQNIKIHTDSQVEGIMNSMKKFGFYAPIVVDGKKNVIIGHGRLEASKRLGLKEVPVIKEKNISEIFYLKKFIWVYFILKYHIGATAVEDRL